MLDIQLLEMDHLLDESERLLIRLGILIHKAKHNLKVKSWPLDLFYEAERALVQAAATARLRRREYINTTHSS